MIKKRDGQIVVEVGRLSFSLSWHGNSRDDLMKSGVWVTGDGVRIPVSEMGDAHLINATNFVIRKIWTEAQRTQYVWTYQQHSELVQELALEETKVLIFNKLLSRLPIWRHFERELEERALTDRIIIPWEEATIRW